MQLFFTNDIRGGFAYFDEDEARHLTQVLRRKVGDAVQLTDGQGHLYQAEIVEIAKKTAVARLISEMEDAQKRAYRLHVAIAPTKNIDRFEWFLEKTTEIGIDSITPLICQRSERTVVKLERLNGIVLSAMKQSLKATLPVLNPAVDFQKFVTADFGAAQKFVAHCHASAKRPLSMAYQKPQDCVILIGPEGDFSENEVQWAQQNGFVGVSLGTSRLRTETAGVVACHTVNLLNDLG